MTKKCNKCKEIKDESMFGKNKKSKDGLNYTCKSCVKEYQKQYRDNNKDIIVEQKKEYYKENRDKIAEYYKENRDKIAEYKKEYQKENQDKKAEYDKKYYKENRDKIAKCGKKYYKENRDKIAKYRKEYGKEYCKENRDKIAKYRKEYRKENRDKIAERNKKYYKENPHIRANYYARHKALIGDQKITKKDWLYIMNLTKWKCVYCKCALTNDTRSVDHIVPLIKGGLHTVDNLIPACRSCNSSKSGKLLHEWITPYRYKEEV